MFCEVDLGQGGLTKVESKPNPPSFREFVTNRHTCPPTVPSRSRRAGGEPARSRRPRPLALAPTKKTKTRYIMGPPTPPVAHCGGAILRGPGGEDDDYHSPATGVFDFSSVTLCQAVLRSLCDGDESSGATSKSPSSVPSTSVTSVSPPTFAQRPHRDGKKVPSW